MRSTSARSPGELSLSGELRPVRGALNAALGARRAGYRRLLVPEANAPEAALVDGIEVSAIPSLTRLADLLHGRWSSGARRTGRSRSRRPCRGPARPRRRARPGRRQARHRDRGGGRPQPADGGPAGGREDHDRAAPAGHPASAELRGGPRDHAGAQRGGYRKRPARHRAAVPRAAPHDLGAGARGRRGAADARRDDARPPRRPVPRRAARVRARGRRRAAAAARGGPRGDHPRAADARVPRERDRRRGVQPLPVRAATGPLRVHGRWSSRATSGA